MKPILRAAALCAAACFGAASPASAQVFGTFASADILPINSHQVGFYLQASDRTLSGLAQLRLSMYPGMDFGFQGGLARVSWEGNDIVTLRLGTDLRVGVANAGEGFPLDIAVGGALGVETSDSYHVLTLLPMAVVSRPFTFGQSGSVSPYAGLGISFANVDANTTRETFVSFPLRLGADVRVVPGLRVSAELQIPMGGAFNEDFGILTGVNLPF